MKWIVIGLSVFMFAALAYVGLYFYYIRTMGYKPGHYEDIIDCTRGVIINNIELTRSYFGNRSSNGDKYINWFKLPMYIHNKLLREERELDNDSASAIKIQAQLPKQYSDYIYAKILTFPSTQAFKRAYHFSQSDRFDQPGLVMVHILENGALDIEYERMSN